MPKEVTNEELARMIAKGFEHVDTQLTDVKHKLDEHDQHFKHIDGRMDHLDARMGRMESWYAATLVEHVRRVAEKL